MSAGTGNDYAEMLEVFEGKGVHMMWVCAMLRVCTSVQPTTMITSYVEDARVYAYVRFETGDEMSRRQKFAFITWIGPRVSPLKKAAVSTDKAFVKAAWPVSEFSMFQDHLYQTCISHPLNSSAIFKRDIGR